jgi:Tfp pilus assembly protein PilN
MIKVNLLGKKAAAAGAVPFGLDEKFGKLGITPADLQDMRPGLVRLAALLAGIYFCNVVPLHFHEAKKAELDLVLAGLDGQSKKLSAELSTKKDIRKQMDQLNKEEVELQRQLNAVSALQKDRSLAFRTLDNMIVSLPQKVWFNGLDYKDRAVTVRGGCWEYFPINDFVKAINESTQFTGVNFKGIASENPTQIVPGVPEAMQKIKNFELEFKVKGTGES